MKKNEFFKFFKYERIKHAREELRKWAVKFTRCNMQVGKGDNKVYPCETCFCEFLGNLVNSKSKEYKEHNKPVDRINEVWRFILETRDKKI
jgi:hypothetical protein